MNTQLNKTFSTPHVGYVNILGELVAPVSSAIASLVLGVYDRVGEWRTKSIKQGKLSRLPIAPAPHVALMTVPAEFVMQPFRKY
jgi:hypothetical protein